MRLITKEERMFFDVKLEKNSNQKLRKLKTALVWFDGSKTNTAAALGVNPSTVINWLKINGLEKACVCRLTK